MPADMNKIPCDEESGALVRTKVEGGLAEVKQRLEKACSQHKELYERYQAIPEEARSNSNITQQHREDCHSEFASSPGMYDGILGVIGESVAEAAAELESGDVDNCFESLRGAMEFLEPIEKKIIDYETAMKAHEQTVTKLADEKEKAKTKEQAKEKEKAGKVRKPKKHSKQDPIDLNY
ncbi:hypothetical protein M409DRAFT_30938 [Zasmidium cellare ATCC 36951]|uniref:Uncharacterized protein n=1 Tax=Zasmidium cellare ATCC 36951 TaxID=1080233 RepID=A0A6A6BX00_ZASCE|nr:uncharacterized protein M409DRAFT_30938 [Zasmidium cellare ATCC 36951]KAF2158568.1 hypothetical protein M409DRAFT_30938 [Zasmidium cellare ATCC 36951]